MHELSIASGIIDIAVKEAADRQLKRIEEIGLRIGALTGVNPEALRFAFEASIADTSLAGAKLNIEIVELSGRCQECGRDTLIRDYNFICEHCGASDLKITGGEELDIVYLKGS